jgi:mannose-1-phosphate guanylyltransferase
MIIVIIAGGSGSRLWPLSTPEYPKHLLNLINSRSLIQNTYSRARLLSEDIYVVSEASHVKHIYEQLPDLAHENVIVEPGRRGTASCVIAALARIKKSHDTDESVVFMHADHHIRDIQGFCDTVRRAALLATEHQRIVLLGVEPTHAATGFGYIERGENANGGKPVYEVKSFKEKPERATAQKYLAAGNYLWNMVYFVAPLQVFEHSIETSAPHLWDNYQKLLCAKNDKEHTDHYLSFDSEAIDIALIERVKGLLVTPGTFDWMDVGSFPDMHLVSPHDDNGNTIVGDVVTERISNSLVRNDTKAPVIVIGLDNVAVIATKNGILVTNKTYAQKVGDVSKRLQEGKK